MNWESWLLSGFLATLALSTLLSLSQGIGLTRMNIPYLLGTMLTPDRQKAKLYGFVIHILNGWLFSELVFGNFIPAISPMIRRKTLETVGWFDETLTAMEDWDLWLRLSLAAEARYLPAVLATYRIQAEGMSQDRLRMDSNRFQVLEKAASLHHTALTALGGSGRQLVADVQNWFGYQAYDRGDWAEAIRRLHASLRVWPWQRRALVLLGLGYVRQWLTSPR